MNVLEIEIELGKGNWECHSVEDAILNRVDAVAYTEKLTFEQRFEGSELTSPMDIL